MSPLSVQLKIHQSLRGAENALMYLCPNSSRSKIATKLLHLASVFLFMASDPPQCFPWPISEAEEKCCYLY